MIEFVLVLLVILWLLGFVHIPVLSSILFSISSHPFTLQSLLLLLLIIWIIGLLPGLFRAIAAILLILWLLSVFGIIIIGGFSHILIIILIGAVILSII